MTDENQTIEVQVPASVTDAAKKLARRSKGPRNLTPEDRERRRLWMKELNSRRHKKEVVPEAV